MKAPKLTPTDVANHLRNDILSGRLQSGHRLTEIDLSRRFGVGRGLIRQALHQLVPQGLVQARANRGVVVAPDAPKAVRDLIVPMRRSIELHALESIFDELDETIFRRWDEILASMKDACAKNDDNAIAEADIAFHRLIVERSGQIDLMVIWEAIIGRMHSHFVRGLWRLRHVSDNYDAHCALLEAFRSGDRATAVRLLASNIEGGGVPSTSRFLRRDAADVRPWAETCGQNRCLVEEKDGAAGEVHCVEIQDSKLHYHERTDEFYYVISGQGTMLLDDEEIELHRGVVVYVPRGVKHKARGNLAVLTVCIPRGVMGDVHELE